MPIPISEDHRQLGEVARAFLIRQRSLEAARATLEVDLVGLPPFWDELAELGWLGLHISEQNGGSGYGLEELVVVVEELGRALAPGPFLPTVWASAVIAESGNEEAIDELLGDLAAGAVATVALGGSVEVVDGVADGDAGVALSAGLASWLLVPVGDDVVVLDLSDSGVSVAEARNLDPTRRAASVSVAGVPVRHVLGGVASIATAIGRTLAAAEAAGGAAACVEASAEYAKVRQQFGRVIGTFQAVKHHAANMLVEQELAVAAAWDAARSREAGSDQFSLAGAVAAAQALPAFLTCAELNIQLHGGIGYTWEHDAHMYLRRAAALCALFGPVARAREDVTSLMAAGVRRDYGLTLPPEADGHRREVRAFLDRLGAAPEADRLGLLLDEGYVNPHWPKPWGRAASAVEQVVIDEEFVAAGVQRPSYGIGGWIIQTLTQHANDDQIARWIRPSLEGEYVWCQLFSEPDAGSDAAGIRTRASRVDGGWLVTGQKIWTSGAQHCNRGWATVRTDPDAPKHKGITMMVIDMKAPEVEVRPLREASGGEAFNEVFFNEYFVPDDDVVGEVDDGWRAARSTLGNERVSIGAGMGGINSGLDLLALVGQASGDSTLAPEAGRLLAESQSMGLLNLRSAARALAGGEPGPEGNVAKLLSGENAQSTARAALLNSGPEAAFTGSRDVTAAGDIGISVVFTRCLTIAGGTSEVVRNQIGERILGLPRDPLIS